MEFAKVIVGLPVDGPFDYRIPEEMEGAIKAGARVKVPFGARSIIGYAVGISRTTSVSRTKDIVALIDREPLLGGTALTLAKKLSEYFCCSWGEAVELMLPPALRKGKKPPEGWQGREPAAANEGASQEGFRMTLLQAPLERRWHRYLAGIQDAAAMGNSTLMLLPDISYAQEAARVIKGATGIEPHLLYRNREQEAAEWFCIHRHSPKVVVGTRSAVFAPLARLGLIIIEEEQDQAYKQDQSPHYHAREAAMMRANLEGAAVMLGGAGLSCEAYQYYQAHPLECTFISEPADCPEVKVIDMVNFLSMTKKKSMALCKYLEDAVFSTLVEKGKTLLFINRKGYSTIKPCPRCGKSILCPRCEIPLVFHSHTKTLACHHCTWQQPLPSLCPHCNAENVSYQGMGTEKLENEVSRLFPQARVKLLEEGSTGIDLACADIFISTSAVIRASQKGVGEKPEGTFDLIGVVRIDHALNRPDFRAAEKVRCLLLELMGMAKKRLVVQTSVPGHHCFTSLQGAPEQFFRTELRQRKQLGYPPYSHFGEIRLRSTSQEKACAAAETLYKKMESGPHEGIEVLSYGPGDPFKLRNYYYCQVLAKSASPISLVKFIKLHLRDLKHSGIIITVDIDPL